MSKEKESAPALAQSPRLRVTMQALRYAEYGANRGQTRSIWIGRKPLQFLVNTWCADDLLNKEVEIAVEIRERDSDLPIYETFWVTTLEYPRQQSAFICREFPEELQDLQPGKIYTYYVSALVNETDDFAERVTRAVAR